MATYEETPERVGRESDPDSVAPSVLAVGGSVGLTVVSWMFLGSVLALVVLIICLVATCCVERVWPGARFIVGALAFLLAMAILFGDVASLPSWLDPSGSGHG